MSEQTKLDLSKPVQTRDGRPVRILATDMQGVDYPVVGLIECEGHERLGRWAIGGAPCSTIDGYGLINVPPRKVKREGWINLYRNPDTETVFTRSAVHASADKADEHAGTDHIATIRIEWEEPE